MITASCWHGPHAVQVEKPDACVQLTLAFLKQWRVGPAAVMERPAGQARGCEQRVDSRVAVWHAADQIVVGPVAIPSRLGSPC